MERDAKASVEEVAAPNNAVMPDQSASKVFYGYRSISKGSLAPTPLNSSLLSHPADI